MVFDGGKGFLFQDQEVILHRLCYLISISWQLEQNLLDSECINGFFFFFKYKPSS